MPSVKIYDIDGNMVEFHAYSVNPRTLEVALWVKQVMTYDENRLLTQVVDTRGGKTETISFTFNERVRKKLANRQFSGDFNSEDHGTKIYDSEGNMTEWLINGQKNAYTYEADGRMIERSVYDGNRLVLKDRYSYEDDDRGNWIAKHEEMFSPENGWVPVSNVTRREITYFK